MHSVYMCNITQGSIYEATAVGTFTAVIYQVFITTFFRFHVSTPGAADKCWVHLVIG